MNQQAARDKKRKEKKYPSVCRGDSRQHLSSQPLASDLAGCFSFLTPSLEFSKSTTRQASHSPLASAGPCLATVTPSVQFSTAVDHRTEPDSDSGRSVLGRRRWVSQLGQETIQIDGCVKGLASSPVIISMKSKRKGYSPPLRFCITPSNSVGISFL